MLRAAQPTCTDPRPGSDVQGELDEGPLRAFAEGLLQLTCSRPGEAEEGHPASSGAQAETCSVSEAASIVGGDAHSAMMTQATPGELWLCARGPGRMRRGEPEGLCKAEGAGATPWGWDELGADL